MARREVTGEDLERELLDQDDIDLLRRHGIAAPHLHGARTREIVLVGRLQRALGLSGLLRDGLYGCRTHTLLRDKELPLGPELSSIVRAWGEAHHR